MALSVVKEDNRFRVEWQGNSTDWLPETPSNRKVVLVFLRWLRDESGKPVFTFQELSKVVDSEKRQASSGHVEGFRECSCDFLKYLTRRRKIDSEVVEAVSQELRETPLSAIDELQQRVNTRLGRKDISSANITVALGQISCHDIRDSIRKRIAAGEAHYKETYLLEEMMSSLSSEANAIGSKAGIQASEADSMHVSDPGNIRKLVNPEIPVSSIEASQRWTTFSMVLYYYGVPLSVLGKWQGVHKTTILRRMLGLALPLWSLVYKWIVDGVKAKAVYVDEKWLKIQGKWYYWFVVLDVATQLPVLATLLPSRSKWACRWIGVKLKSIGKMPGVIITDGLLSYHYLLEGAKHMLCHFHHQQGVTSLSSRKRGMAEEEIP